MREDPVYDDTRFAVDETNPFRSLPAGKIVARGKTKQIYRLDSPRQSICAIRSLDALTALNGAKQGGFPGKGALSTTIACSHFALLRRHGLPVAFYEQWGEEIFIAPFCAMIKIEVVARFVANPRGSYVKRYPQVVAGQHYTEPVIEFFLKTTGGELNGKRYPCDDPYLNPLSFTNLNEGFAIHHPDQPISQESQIGTISIGDLRMPSGGIREITRLMREGAIVLRDAWKDVGGELHDFKAEFGYLPNQSIMFADVIDNDSHRLLIANKDRSKQGWRDNLPIEMVIANYHMVAERSERFPF